MLKLIIEIDREKSDKSRFIVGKRYTLNTRGKRRLVADVQTWLGTQALSGDEMKKFSPEKVFLNKPCQATVTYETEDGQTVARAASYLAAGETKLTPSGKYVRSELTAPTADAVQTAPIPSGAPQPAIA